MFVCLFACFFLCVFLFHVSFPVTTVCYSILTRPPPQKKKKNEHPTIVGKIEEYLGQNVVVEWAQNRTAHNF